MSQKISIIFAGTDQLSTSLLRALASDGRFDMNLVITAQDKPAGRKMELAPPPVKVVAQELGISILQPSNINETETLEEMRKHSPALLLVMAFGQKLSTEALNLPSIASVNPHISLLPKYRGASPVQSALLNGDTESGVSLIRMTEGMDEGPVYSRFPLPIEPSDNRETLTQKLADLSAEKIPDALVAIASGLEPQAQDNSQASHCAKISKEDGRIDWSQSAERIHSRVRAFYGWPGTFTLLEDKRLKILKTALSDESVQKEPGTLFESDGKLLVQTGDGALEILEMQPESKKPQSAQEFLRGNQSCQGKRLS